jgi:3-deoxy-D-manno-octulosonic-acid transferase
LVTFSPSGYEVRKNNALADVTVYLPLDTKKNAQQFLELIHPDMVFLSNTNIGQLFIELKNQILKPDFWNFKKKTLFFKWYGGFIETLDALLTFVQNESSKTCSN